VIIGEQIEREEEEKRPVSRPFWEMNVT